MQTPRVAARLLTRFAFSDKIRRAAWISLGKSATSFSPSVNSRILKELSVMPTQGIFVRAIIILKLWYGRPKFS